MAKIRVLACMKMLRFVKMVDLPDYFLLLSFLNPLFVTCRSRPFHRMHVFAIVVA